MRILPIIVMVACLMCQAMARPQDDAEPRAVSNRGALLKRGLAGKQKTTTTTPAQEEVEYEDEGDYPAEGEAQEPSTEAAPTSTEGKKLIAGLPVRPFRSNTDLLESLKRRRAQVTGGKSQGGSSSVSQQQVEAQTEAPVKANFSKKRFNTATRETKAEDAPAPAPSKPSRGRFGRPSSRSVQEAEPEEQNDTTPPPARTGRQFSRRGGN